MPDTAEDFVRLLESRECWGFKEHGDDVLGRAERIASLILEDIHAAGLVPVPVWTLFIALLPLGKSLEALSDLSLVLPKIIERIVSLVPEREDIAISQQVIIERLNQLTRRNLHNEILTQKRSEAIKTALRYADGHH